MKKEIDLKNLYLCSPLLNKQCTKESCYINNGACCHTVNKEYSQEYLLDYITNLQDENERLNNIINNFDKLIDELYKELDHREHGDSYIYDYDGNRIILDVGYAFEGIEFFIKELKHKLKEDNK